MGDGEAGSMPASEFAAWFSSDASLPYNDIQIHGLPVTGDIEGYMQSGKNYRTEAFPGMTMAPYQVRPYSRGQLQLKSRHPEELASIRMNFLHDERDRKALLGARLMGVRGRWEQVDGVEHLIARQLEDFTHLLGEIQPGSRDFH